MQLLEKSCCLYFQNTLKIEYKEMTTHYHKKRKQQKKSHKKPSKQQPTPPPKKKDVKYWIGIESLKIIPQPLPNPRKSN